MEVMGFFNNVAPSLMNLPGISSKPVLFEAFREADNKHLALSM